MCLERVRCAPRRFVERKIRLFDLIRRMDYGIRRFITLVNNLYDIQNFLRQKPRIFSDIPFRVLLRGDTDIYNSCHSSDNFYTRPPVFIFG